jgi:hypothetical protein
LKFPFHHFTPCGIFVSQILFFFRNSVFHHIRGTFVPFRPQRGMLCSWGKKKQRTWRRRYSHRLTAARMPTSQVPTVYSRPHSRGSRNEQSSGTVLFPLSPG